MNDCLFKVDVLLQVESEDQQFSMFKEILLGAPPIVGDGLMIGMGSTGYVFLVERRLFRPDGVLRVLCARHEVPGVTFIELMEADGWELLTEEGA